MTDFLWQLLMLSNEITAIIGIFILTLCFKGYLPHIRLGGRKDPRTWITMMILSVDTLGVLRMAYWDVYRSIYANFVEGAFAVSSLHGTLINTGFNTATSMAGLCGLAALYYAIPEEDRATGKWHLLNAHRYPNEFWVLKWRTY
jgi:hypothetical protein